MTPPKLSKHFASRSGQSLLEMMIALSMLTIVFMGIATLLERSFFLNQVATNETIGSYLAAEGIEITKSIIDHDMYGGVTKNGKSTWGVDFPGGFGSSLTYSPVFTTVTFLNNAAPRKPTTPLKFDPNNPIFGYAYNLSSGKNTPFTRLVTIIKPNSNHYEIDVISTVTWSTGPLTKETITDEDHFYDWNPSN